MCLIFVIYSIIMIVSHHMFDVCLSYNFYFDEGLDSKSFVKVGGSWVPAQIKQNDDRVLL